MKLYEYNKNNNVCLIKICGFSIFEQTNDLINLNKKQRFCSGIIETDKIIFSDGVIKDIKVFGVSVIKRKDLNGFRKYYILGKEIFSVALYELFKRRYVKYFDSKYDNIYILHANCGEVYLTLVHFFDAIIKKHQSQNPLLVATQKCHVDLIKMICPNVPYIYLKNMDILVKDSCFKIDKFRIFILYDDSYYHQTEKNIISSRIGECHYFNSLKEKLELSNDDITMRKIIISDKEKLSVLNKVRQIGLNLDRFIFISPEANTCKLYDDDFWIELIKKIEETGYDVFFILTNNEMNLKDFVNFIKNSPAPFKIRVKVSANSKKNSIEFQKDYIKLKISKPALEGKANKEIISFLSDILNLPKNNIKIVNGEKSSLKMLLFIPKTLQ